MRTHLLFILLAGVMLCFPSTSHAQSLSLSIQPPLIETAIKPGKSVLVGFTVSNLGDPAIISTHVSTFQPDGVDGRIKLTDTQDTPIRFNLENSNIQLEKPFLLKGKKGQQLLLKMRVPEGTPEGDYYFTFYAQNVLGRGIEGQPSARAQARIGANILMTVTSTGDVDVEGSIGKLSIEPRYNLRLFGRVFPIVESSDSIPVSLILQNTGTNLIKPQGTLELEGSFGQKATFPLVAQNILKKSSRLIQASQSANVSRTSDDQRDTSLSLKGFFVGRYTIRAVVNFGDNTANDTATFVFYALPYKLIIAFVCVVILSAIALKKFRQS